VPGAGRTRLAAASAATLIAGTLATALLTVIGRAPRGR